MDSRNCGFCRPCAEGKYHDCETFKDLHPEIELQHQLEAAKQRELELLAVIENITGVQVGYCPEALYEHVREKELALLKDVIAEWERPYGLTDGVKFIDRLRRMAEERMKK